MSDIKFAVSMPWGSEPSWNREQIAAVTGAIVREYQKLGVKIEYVTVSQETASNNAWFGKQETEPMRASRSTRPAADRLADAVQVVSTLLGELAREPKAVENAAGIEFNGEQYVPAGETSQDKALADAAIAGSYRPEGD